jgi:hypothetical protein
MGCIIRDEEGLVQVAATWSRNGIEDAFVAEAFALYAAMVLALSYGYTQMIFEGDCKVVIDKLKKKSANDRSYLGSFLKEIWNLIGYFEICKFQFTPRNCNQVAHSLTSLAHVETNNIWWAEVPSPVQAMYFSDIIH